MRSSLLRGLIAATLSFGAVAVLAQSFPLKYDSAASTNSTLVIAGKTQLRSLVISNSSVTVDWLKLYDVATAPTCGTTSPVAFKTSTPATAVTVVEIPDGIQFQNGIGFCLTGAQADSDNSNGNTGIVLNFGIKQ